MNTLDTEGMTLALSDNGKMAWCPKCMITIPVRYADDHARSHR